MRDVLSLPKKACCKTIHSCGGGKQLLHSTRLSLMIMNLTDGESELLAHRLKHEINLMYLSLIHI